jgi:23S rRNA (uridine2552-2'-O)-methyltransferase
MAQKPRNPYARPDAKTIAAKKAGYPARSVFKLEEIDRRVRLLRQGQRVLDLGAAPGSWAMYASGKVGGRGHVLAIDLQPLRVSVGKNATIVEGDAFQIGSDLYLAHGPFDVVLSDMAPSTSGSRDADQFRSYELCMRAVEVALAHGTKGSSFVGKIFMSDDYPRARDALRAAYDEVRTIRPEGTRANSTEVFLVALGKKAGPAIGAPEGAPSPAPLPGGA